MRKGKVKTNSSQTKFTRLCHQKSEENVEQTLHYTFSNCQRDYWLYRVKNQRTEIRVQEEDDQTKEDETRAGRV